MRIRLKHLMIVVAIEAVLVRAALAIATYRDLPLVFGKHLGLWLTLHLMGVLPGLILWLRSQAGPTSESTSAV